MYFIVVFCRIILQKEKNRENFKCKIGSTLKFRLRLRRRVLGLDIIFSVPSTFGF